MHETKRSVKNRRADVDGKVRGGITPLAWVALAGLAGSLGAGCGRQAIATTDALPVSAASSSTGTASRTSSARGASTTARCASRCSDRGRRFPRDARGDGARRQLRARRGVSRSRDDEDEEAKPPTAKPDRKTPTRKKGLETSCSSLDGKEHDLQVGLRRRVARVAAVVSARGPRRGRSRPSGVGHRAEPLGRGLEEREAVARRGRAARVPGASSGSRSSRRGRR